MSVAHSARPAASCGRFSLPRRSKGRWRGMGEHFFSACDSFHYAYYGAALKHTSAVITRETRLITHHRNRPDCPRTTRKWHVMSSPVPADLGSLPSAAGLDGPKPAETIQIRESQGYGWGKCVWGLGQASPLLVWQICSCPRGRCGRRDPRDAPGYRRSESPSVLKK